MLLVQISPQRICGVDSIPQEDLNRRASCPSVVGLE